MANARFSKPTLVIRPGVDIYKYPDTINTGSRVEGEQLSIGDLHGNAIKLLYFLIREGVITLPKEKYETLSYIYQSFEHLNGPIPPSLIPLLKAQLDTFNSILKEIIVVEKPLVRLLGDELCDRGSNDYFTLKIFEQLQRQNLPFEILLSNHGAGFLEALENNFTPITDVNEYKRKYPVEADRKFSDDIVYESQTLPCWNNQSASLQKLGLLMQAGLVSKQEVEDIAHSAYLPNLKVLSYSFMPGILTIYTHAPVGLETMAGLANISTKDAIEEMRCAASLTKLIDKINVEFSDALKQSFMSRYFPVPHASTDVGNLYYSALFRIAWNRDYRQIDNSLPFPTDYELFFNHGHHGHGAPVMYLLASYINLDNGLGKKSPDQDMIYSIVVSFNDPKALALSKNVVQVNYDDEVPPEFFAQNPEPIIPKKTEEELKLDHLREMETLTRRIAILDDISIPSVQKDAIVKELVTFNNNPDDLNIFYKNLEIVFTSILTLPEDVINTLGPEVKKILDNNSDHQLILISLKVILTSTKLEPHLSPTQKELISSFVGNAMEPILKYLQSVKPVVAETHLLGSSAARDSIRTKSIDQEAKPPESTM